MSRQPPAALAAAIAADQSKMKPTEDRLERARDAVRRFRDTQKEIADADAHLKELKARETAMRMKELPDLFSEVGVDHIGLPAEGNLPAYDAEMKPYYFANIAADWEPERRGKAFDWLDQEGHGDIIRSTFTVFIGKDDRDTALKVETALKALGVPFETSLTVPWNTLTAFVKEQVEKHKTTPPLDLLGAVVGSVVNLKERKDK